MAGKLIGRNGKRTITDLRGQRFGRLIVQMFAGITGVYTRWTCQCDCGNRAEVSGRCLVRGNTTSCGCFAKEQQSSSGRKVGGHNKKPDTSFRGLFDSYRRKAVKRGLKFAITVEQFAELTQRPCFYCGVSPYNTYKCNHSTEPYVYNGVDRVDSMRGYLPGNCVTACKVCNQAKAGMEQTAFAAWIRKVHHHWAASLSSSQ